MELLHENGVGDVLVMAGGILPDEDIPAIKAMGIKGNFGPGTAMATIIDFVQSNVDPDRLEQELGPVSEGASFEVPASGESSEAAK